MSAFAGATGFRHDVLLASEWIRVTECPEALYRYVVTVSWRNMLAWHLQVEETASRHAETKTREAVTPATD